MNVEQKQLTVDPIGGSNTFSAWRLEESWDALVLVPLTDILK